MKYNFDRAVDRVETNDMKWHPDMVESYINHKISKDIIPMWLADTEFPCPPMIVSAIKQRADKEIFGYSSVRDQFKEAICFWQRLRFNWEISKEWIVGLPTVVAGINIAIRAFSEKGDGVIIQQPVYDPFATIIKNTGRKVVNNSLILRDGKYEMNYEELEYLASKPENKIMILCSPHNPVGRVWTEEELTKLGDICLRNNIMIISDEIHSDIVFNGHKHYPFLNLKKEYSKFILLSAPGKTFNVAGLKVSIAVIPEKNTRNTFQKVQKEMSLDILNTFGLECVSAAYTKAGEEWMLQEISYIEKNAEYIQEYVKSNMPGVSMVKSEGTFLCWLDFSKLSYSEKELIEKIIIEQGVICIPGSWFGEGGQHHFRINIGCQRQLLEKAMCRIRKAIL